MTVEPTWIAKRNGNSEAGRGSATTGPIMFVSSFYAEASFATYHDSPLWRLRRDLHLLNVADDFAPFHEKYAGRKIAWVAEWSERELSEKPSTQQLEVVDRLVEVLIQSELYVCILGDARRGAKDHGSAIPVADGISATSYFEIELYAAAMYAKPVYIYVLEGFSPGPRLEFLLRLLASIPNWRNQKPMSSTAILSAVRQQVMRHLQSPSTTTASLRKRLVREFYLVRAKNAPPGHEPDNVLFLDGQFESRRLPQKDLIESLIADYERMPEMQRRLSRMWLAARELMSASYLQKDTQADGRLLDFLPLWDKVLGLWTRAAAWSGWHGHLYAGTVAPLNSQTVIRSQGTLEGPPNGALASAYYSIANLMPVGYRRFQCLWRALRYVGEAISLSGAQNPGELAIRGSIRMRLGNPWAAVLDFKRMLRLYEQSHSSEEQIGNALVHVGFGYLHCGRFWKGRGYLERGVQAIATGCSPAEVARAKRKLALAYRLTGRRYKAHVLYQEANAIAYRIGALDQVNR